MEKKKKKKKAKWIKPRHTFFRNILYPFVYLLCKIKYNIKIKKCKDKRQLLVVSNHQTTYDQFFLGMAFKKHLYYVTNDDLFSNGFVSWLISFLVKPIPIKKGTTDVKAVMDCMRVVREGGSIGIFPEGNRTYSGKTEAIKESIGDFAKALKLPIAIFHINGGYGKHPRWSDKTRGGKMTAGVSEIIEYDEYKSLSSEELYKLICDKLYVDEGIIDGEYPSKRSAENLERAMYYCPSCGISEWTSEGEYAWCKNCGTKIKYLPTKELLCVNGTFPYRFMTEWYDAQSNYMRALDLAPYDATPLFSDTANLYEVIPCKKKIPLGEGIKFSAFSDRFEIDFGGRTETVYYKDITASGVLGRNKMNYYTQKRIFQIKSDKHFNAVKYVNVYYHALSILKGDTQNGFLGL